MHGRNISGASQTAGEEQDEREREMSSKKKLQPNKPKIIIVRRRSINSGKPNCEYL